MKTGSQAARFGALGGNQVSKRRVRFQRCGAVVVEEEEEEGRMLDGVS